MSELVWFELSPPRDLELSAVTAMLRPLADRPRTWLGTTLPVVFEIWSLGGSVKYLLGVDHRLAKVTPRLLVAQLPRLGIVAHDGVRPVPTLAADLQLREFSAPLRTDTASAISRGIIGQLRGITAPESAVISWVLGPARPRSPRPTGFDVAASLGFRMPEKPDDTALRLFREKASEPLIACRGRIGASTETPQRAYNLIRGLAGTLRLANSQHAALRLGKASAPRATALGQVTVPTLRWSCVLNANELASLLGWSLLDVPTEGLPVIGGHVNLAPSSLRVAEDAAADRANERILGTSVHPSERGDLVTLPVEASLHHVHVVGPTGSGKSTLLAGLITADIAAGRGVLVIEPRGDLIDDVLARVPEQRRDDVVLIDPANSDRVVGLNVLAGSAETAERRADEVVGLLAALHGANFGPRTADIALHATLTAARLPGGTLADVSALLTQTAFRTQTLAKVADDMTLSLWWAWFNGLSDSERSSYTAPLLNKLRGFLNRQSLRRMLGQPEPNFHLDDVFTKKRIVLINLNRGLLGGPTSNLLGALVMSQLWSALQRRAAVPREERNMVGLYVDEFQDYVDILGGLDFEDALAQSRGLGGAWTLAHQHLGQLSTSLQAAVIANARSRVVFHPATNDARPLAAALGGDLTAEDLLRLRAYEACCSVLVDKEASLPFTVRTRPLGPGNRQPDQIRRLSAEHYGADGDAVDEAMKQRWEGASGPPKTTGGIRARRKLS